MKNLQDVWSTRFLHYITEVQKYMRYVFTGHIAIVLVFIVGAGGYQYSEWLKVAPTSFPGEWLVAVMIGLIVAFSRPTTLLREPDQVYLLPLESKMPSYLKKALRWTFWSQIFIVIICYIVAIPLLNTVTELSSVGIWAGILFAIGLKYLNVELEFAYRYSERGAGVLLDRLWRILVSFLTMLFVLMGNIVFGIIGLLVLISVLVYMKKRKLGETIPYEHFVSLEQTRMMGFYRFANYFTDVPHLRGSIRRRAWLDWLYKSIALDKKNTQFYLVYRTFIRTDDYFYLWLRLTAISSVISAFVDIPIVSWIVVGALSFATTIQLKQALLTSHDFRMDMLYPVPVELRGEAIRKLLRMVIVKQAVIVMLCSIGQPLFYIAPVVIVIVGEITERMSKSR